MANKESFGLGCMASIKEYNPYIIPALYIPLFSLLTPMKAIGFRVIGHHPDQRRQWAPHGDFPKLGFFVGAHDKDYSIWGSLFGSLYVGKLPYFVLSAVC